METTCLIEGCDLPVLVKSRGWCRKHYHRWHRTGDPLSANYERASGTPLERWWAKVQKEPDDGCWLWIGSKDRRGYGQFGVVDEDGRRNHRAHRWGYQQLVRALADDETMDHLCRVRACVRPDHLEPVLHLVNVQRGEAGQRNAVKTHCSQGHEFSPENTAINDRGWRTCITCRRESTLQAVRKARGYQGNTPNGEKTHCKNGHEFTPENTIVRKDGKGRNCRECSRAAVRDYMRRKRAASD